MPIPRKPTRRRTSTRPVVFTVACGGLVGLALTMSGCGQAHVHAGTNASSRPTFNHQDVSFAQKMIPRQRQARLMATLANANTNNPAVLMMASRIQASQGSWTNALSSCLMGWGSAVPRGTMMASPGSGSMMGGDNDGMMSRGDLAGLAARSGAQFDQTFLAMMVRHDRATIELADAEAARGLDPAAVKLAQKVRTTQMRELMEMQHMLSH